MNYESCISDPLRIHIISAGTFKKFYFRIPRCSPTSFPKTTALLFLCEHFIYLLKAFPDQCSQVNSSITTIYIQFSTWKIVPCMSLSSLKNELIPCFYHVFFIFMWQVPNTVYMIPLSISNYF